MNKKSSDKSKKGLILKIIIPVLLVCIVVGIWAIKNNKNDTGAVSVSGNPDFALHVTEKLDMEKLKSYGLPIIIDFGSDSCIPCKQMAPVLEELNAELLGKVIIRFVDVWKYQGFADGYPISVIPTQIFFDAKGEPYKPKDPQAMQVKQYSSDTGEHTFTAHEGGATKEQLLSMLKKMGLK